MGLPVGEIQTAFITRYRGDATLQGLLVGSVAPTWNISDADAVPTNQAFPYVVVQPITAKSGTALAMGMDATDVYMQVSAFTMSRGFAQARAIMKQIYALTNEYSFPLTGGFSNFFTLFDNYQELDSGGVDSIQQITARFRLMTQG